MSKTQKRPAFPPNLGSIIPALDDLCDAGEPITLKIGAVGELVVGDRASYDRLIALVDWLETVEGVRAGLESAARGEGRPVEEFFEELRQKYELPDRNRARG